MRRRHLTIATSALLGGVLVNIAVAWTFAAIVDGKPVLERPASGIRPASPPRWSIAVYTQPGTTVVEYEKDVPRRPEPLAPDHSPEEMKTWLKRVNAFHRRELANWPLIDPPYWSGANGPVRTDESWRHQFVEDARGWPMRSLLVRHQRTTAHSRESTACLDLGRRQGPAGLPMALPLTPIPLGFAVNTVLFAAVIWCGVALPDLIIRAGRKRKGRCPSCGYDLRSGDLERCPECGNLARTVTIDEMSSPLARSARVGRGKSARSR